MPRPGLGLYRLCAPPRCAVFCNLYATNGVRPFSGDLQHGPLRMARSHRIVPSFLDLRSRDAALVFYLKSALPLDYRVNKLRIIPLKWFYER